MNIRIFGCSWSYGVPEVNNFKSWANYLAQKHIGYTVYNYSYGGVSNMFNLHNMLKIKKLYPDDFYIFQGTSRSRYTYIDDDFDCDALIQKTFYNYYQMDTLTPKMIRVNTTHAVKNGNYSDIDFNMKKKHYKSWIANTTLDQLRIENLVHFVAATKIADFCFLHQAHENHDLKKFFGLNYFCVEDYFGDDFAKLVEDEGDHLGKKGCKKQADVIKHMIRNKENGQINETHSL